MAIGTVNGTSYPIPKLNIVGKYNVFYEGDCNLIKLKKAILLDASSSYLPPTVASYYYKFEIGTDVIETTNPRQRTKLTSTGTLNVYLTVNDQPFTNTGTSSYGVTRGGNIKH